MDFISFHAKGAQKITDGKVDVGINRRLTDADMGLLRLPNFRSSEFADHYQRADPEVALHAGAICDDTAAAPSVPLTRLRPSRLLGCRIVMHVNLLSVGGPFEFEDHPDTSGSFRSLTTNGVDKPVLNIQMA